MGSRYQVEPGGGRVWVTPLRGTRPRKAERARPSTPPPRVVLAYDPGVEGALVALSLVTDHARFWRVRPQRLDGFPVMNLRWICQAFAPGSVPVVYVEHVMGRGGWSAGSNFSFGAIAGAAISLMREYGWEVKLVRPQVWQAAVFAAADAKAPVWREMWGTGKTTSKEKTLAAYRTLFPSQPLPLNQVGEPEHNTIDALLLAYYGVMEAGCTGRDWRFQKGAR